MSIDSFLTMSQPTMAFSGPRPNRPPLPADWAQFRDVIVDLYMREDKTLPQVRRYMALTYSFIATEKMFKDRLTKWEVYKNYSEEDVRRLFQRIADGEATLENATIHGLPVKWPRVRRRIYEGMPGLQFNLNDGSWLTIIEHAQNLSRRQSQQRSNVVRRPRQTGAAQSMPRILYTSSQLEAGRRLLVEMKTYLDGRLFEPIRVEYRGYINSWLPVGYLVDDDLDAPVDVMHPAELNQNLSRGIRLLLDARVEPGRALILRASDVLDELFQHQHGALTCCLLDAFTGSTTRSYPLTKGRVGETTIEVATRILGHCHPVTLLCKYLHQSTNSEANRRLVFYFWGHYCKLYSNSMGLEHPMAIYINQIYLEKLLDGERFEDASQHMRTALDPIFTGLFLRQPRIDINVPASLCYLRRRARLHRCSGHSDRALQTLKISKRVMIDAMQKMQAGVAGNPILEEVFRTFDEIAIYYDSLRTVNSRARALEVHAFALQVCIFVRGETDGKTYSMVSSLERRYSDIGDPVRANALRLRFPEVFWEGEGAVDIVRSTRHLLPCSFCGNGSDTQIFCDRHNTSNVVTEIEGKQMVVILDQIRALFMENDQGRL
ncbi:uncharacterized protein Z518_05298 [Rhinocladiella mackenziei CBS 650.93]|uniref:Clr5 domain-containing protein n=1 Tax=Rhinocladiella mackenziei CBS 650.93 TaxID=1442369 RepID=A0A0D2J5V4_9EURO|nr:uncharacterized protein Z518_05298 [Rhinocladiella mackenziei CBS 650.93]KIX04430.1 hypothetical protein Z518_05298 [Rhinocladiella mackenziei CBS 650.93]